MAKLDNVLRETLIEVESKLRDDLDIERKKAKENYFKTVPELSKKQERLKKIEEKQEALRKEYREIENDIKNLDPNISVDVIHELNKQENLELNCYSSKQSDVATARAIKDTKADINIKAFNKIKTQIKNQFNLAITPKQKQQVIL
jgi:Tfp pilus assembly protein PilO